MHDAEFLHKQKSLTNLMIELLVLGAGLESARLQIATGF